MQNAKKYEFFKAIFWETMRNYLKTWKVWGDRSSKDMKEDGWNHHYSITQKEKSEKHSKNIWNQNNITKITSHECCDFRSSQKTCDDITSQSN